MRRQPAYPCPTCGGFARIPVEKGKQFACARCGTVLPPLPFAGETTGRMENPTPIRHGMKAMIGGKEFWAIGLIRYEEPEDEGGTSVWYEWVLMNPDGDMRYLEYDEGRFTMTQPFDGGMGLEGVFGAGDGAAFTIGGTRVLVQESGTCAIANFEGQIPWEIRRGEMLRYVDLTRGDTLFSAEMSAETGIIEWFKGRRVVRPESPANQIRPQAVRQTRPPLLRVHLSSALDTLVRAVRNVVRERQSHRVREHNGNAGRRRWAAIRPVQIR
jgi:hypothetical protein